ncbi:MAG: hypothetical protein IMY74_08210 [Bacteroidetes bacterium]|nr:hypothetical protein [Bacteroidota bacterium]
MSFEKAAAIPLSTFTSLICLCDLGQMKSGQKVLVNGASGGVGTLAVPFAKSFGAEVTGMLETLLVIFDLEPLIILVIPNGLFELTIGLWLMLKGIRLYKIESYKLKWSATTYYSILKGIKLKLSIILK